MLFIKQPRLLLAFIWLIVSVQATVRRKGGRKAWERDLKKLPVCADCTEHCMSTKTKKISGKSYHGTEADYVVVGAGTSGSILASRLAAAGHRVILLEAGGTTQREFGRKKPFGNETTVFDVPLEWLEICRNPSFNHYQWDVSGSPKVAIAKGIGGCSIHNAMLYMRGIAEDFEEWPEGWKFADVLPFYTRSENNSVFPSSVFHGKSGPIQISSPHKRFHDSVTPKFIQAFEELGYRLQVDFNGPVTIERPSETGGRTGRTGAGYLQFAIREGVRDSSAAAYFGKTHPGAIVKPEISLHGHCAHPRKNTTPFDDISIFEMSRLYFRESRLMDQSLRRLRILGHSLATKIIFNTDKEVPIAKAVEFVRLDKYDKPKCRCVAFGTKEIIISAGTINSPKLLMTSGIGPEDHLKHLKIPVLSSVPGMGQNFMDGAYAVIQYEAPDLKFQRCEQYQTTSRRPGGRMPYQAISNSSLCQKMWDLYIENGKGLFGTPGFFAGAFLQSPGNARPNIQLTLHPYDKVNQQPWAFKMGKRNAENVDACQLDKTKCNDTTSHNSRKGKIITIEVAHNLPKSRGNIKLNNSHPLAPAVLEGNYLSVQSDVDALVWAMTQVRTIFNTFALKPLIGKELLPGKHILSGEHLERYIRCANTNPLEDGCENPNAPVVGHLAGTCKMGDLDMDPLAVVDPSLRVRGVRHLRVVDASIMPSLPSGNTHATCMMIAEKAASIILGEKMPKKILNLGDDDDGNSDANGEGSSDTLSTNIGSSDSNSVPENTVRETGEMRTKFTPKSISDLKVDLTVSVKSPEGITKPPQRSERHSSESSKTFPKIANKNTSKPTEQVSPTIPLTSLPHKHYNFLQHSGISSSIAALGTTITLLFIGMCALFFTVPEKLRSLLACSKLHSSRFELSSSPINSNTHRRQNYGSISSLKEI